MHGANYDQAWHLYGDIERGAEFFFSEEDYLSPEQLNGTSSDSKRPRVSRVRVKAETPPASLASSSSSSSVAGSSKVKLEKASVSPMKGRKRLRRSAASTVKSYAVPDSDDEAIVDEKPDTFGWDDVKQAKKRRSESNLQRWIKHLTVLQKEEQKKVSLDMLLL